jgi:hypothetical protein
MKIRLLALTGLLAVTAVAFAHTHLKQAMPADNAELTAPPKQIMLHFSEETRLTALSIQKDGEEEATVVSALPKQATAEFSVPVDVAGPGKYTVNWRAVGADNHVMSGKLHFTVKSK